MRCCDLAAVGVGVRWVGGWVGGGLCRSHPRRVRRGCGCVCVRAASSYEVPAHTALPFIWSEPMKPQRELVLTVGKKSRRLDLATIGDHKPLVVQISPSKRVAARRAACCWPC